MRDDEQHFVQVVSWKGVVVKTLGPHSERKAEKIDRGMQHNLDHDRYYTIVTPADYQGKY